jgi:hypothetical protein
MVRITRPISNFTVIVVLPDGKGPKTKLYCTGTCAVLTPLSSWVNNGRDVIVVPGKQTLTKNVLLELSLPAFTF